MIRFATFNFDDPGNARADIDNLGTSVPKSVH